MLRANDKHITIQFHFHDNNKSLKRLNGLGLPISKHTNSFTKIKSHNGNSKNPGIQLLESFAKRNAYDYELYQLKEELHLKVPENRLQKHIIQNKKAQLQNYESSNKALNQESLSLINFIGDVVFNPSHDSVGASLIRGFIKTSKDNRIFHYSKTAIDKQSYQSAKSAFDMRFQKSELNSTGCLGITNKANNFIHI
jgi:hypothetical protein